jgi:hypothetical protein
MATGGLWLRKAADCRAIAKLVALAAARLGCHLVAVARRSMTPPAPALAAGRLAGEVVVRGFGDLMVRCRAFRPPRIQA